MAIGRIVHWIGVVFVVAAFALLLVTCIGAPAVNDIGLLRVTLHNASSAVFGPFGYCVLDVARGGASCSKASIGYIPAEEMRLLDPTTVWTTWKGHDLDLMTEAYILFPIACAIAFFAASFAFCGVIGSLIASVLCATAFVVTLAVMVVALISFGYLKSHVQAHGLKVKYGVGMWTCVAAFVLLFLAMLLLFFSCCSGLRGKHRNKQNYKEKDLRHREDSERSVNQPHSHNNHHLGRDAALGTAGLGAYEAEKHHRNNNAAANGNSRDRHYGRDAAIGGAGVGAYEAEQHHRDHNENATGNSSNHHYGRDTALAGAGVGAYEAEQHHRNHSGRRHPPANAAAARAIAGTSGHYGGNDYESTLADQDRQNLGHGHAGRDAAIGAGALGAAGLGAHEYERSRTNNGPAGVAAPAPREHKLRETMRDSSNRGYEEPLAASGRQNRNVATPAHHVTTHQGRSPPPFLMDPAVITHNTGNERGSPRFPEHQIQSGTVTHHHPTVTTNTATYADERGVYHEGPSTTYGDGRAI